MKNFHRSIRIQGLQRGLEQQLNHPGHLVDPPTPATSHYLACQNKGMSSPSPALSLTDEAHFHVLAEADR